MDLLDTIFTKIAKIPQKPFNNVIFWSGMLLSLSLLAQITWKMVPDTMTASKWQPIPVEINRAGKVNVKDIEKLALFGQYTADAKDKPKANIVEQITDAPKTTLSIQLTGVVASTTEQKGLAIIASSGGQDTYSLGDKIKGTSASLKEVYVDRIIITNNGRYETLMLDGLQYEAQGQANKQLQKAKTNKDVRKIDHRENKAVSEQLKMSRDELVSDPGKITDYLSISPVRKNGKLAGYRLNAGKDRALFTQSGLKPNDLAKSINGYDLTDMGQALEVMSSLPELTEMSLMVERKGQLIEIMFSLPQ
ncbi:type II secretion system protein GspC [Shewanella surugensis]|uniref:Type II secretion system protein GspC n=1 Tax=Shewanella surugensis TaxID=212020 RepID=A0ABT0L8J0_9GAMM|nr:type II secretion system protein GspC [Shewanella surugensis]MCL1124019.1 type II secretion system protein GspC [Shewanella surugensis]